MSVVVLSSDLQANAALKTLERRPEWQPVSHRPAEAAVGLAVSPAQLVILDTQGRDESGLDAVARLACGGVCPVIALVAEGDVTAAAEAVRRGAVDALEKPVAPERLEAALGLAREQMALNEPGPSGALPQLEHPGAFTDLVTQDARMLEALRYAEAIAHSPMPVLITGETGTGKELLAKAIHNVSGRAGEFIAVNAAGLDDALFSDTLFGHHRGAYTGAEGQREGLIRSAEGGTLFLDEVGDLGPASQTKLLRLAQDYEYYPLGSDELRNADVRILAATNRRRLREQAGFRDDLFYRLSTHRVDLPPLRDRMADLPLLVSHFLDKAARVLNKPRPSAPREVLDLLGAYAFPGNVRELESMVLDAVSRHRKRVLSLRSFQEHIMEARTDYREGSDVAEAPFAALRDLPTVRECQRLLIEEAMRRANGNQGVAAQLVSLSRTGLNKALKRIQTREESQKG